MCVNKVLDDCQVEYDNNGNLIRYKDSNGYEQWYDYDENGNCIHNKDSNGFEYWNDYDENGNLIHYKDSNGCELWKGYDNKQNCLTLNDTVSLMNSDDYKERFKAEYLQTKIRYDKLHKMCVKYEAGTLEFNPSCSLELLKEQKSHMGQYLHCLEVRAEIENVDLN